MNISNIGGSVPTPASDPSLAKNTKSATTGEGQNPVAPLTAPTSRPAEVKLSPLSEKLKALASEYAANTTFDSKKVEALKAAIADGSFKVNAAAVADKMIAEAKDLAGKKS